MVEIKEIINENNRIKTLFLDAKIDAIPGQFVMVWLPRIDEKPFSLSYIGDKIAITVLLKGKFTEKLHSLKQGDSIETSANAKATVILYESVVITLDPNTIITLDDLGKSNLMWVKGLDSNQLYSTSL